MHKKAVVILLGIFLLVMVVMAVRGTGSQGASALRSSGKVGVVEINGVIGPDNPASMFNGPAAGSGKIMEAIRKAAGREDIKVLVLRINSPGGTSVASQEIGIELERFKKTGKPVVTSMGDVCASGGYWIAAGSDHIVANPATLTGSIGVIMEINNVEGLYEKLGISQQNIKSGKYKDMGSPTRELTPQERAFLEEIVSDSYQQFLEQVTRGRQEKMSRQEIEKIADGRIFTGKKALQIGLVDSLGNYYDAIKQARELAGLDENSSVEVLNRTGFFEDILNQAILSRMLWQQNSLQLNY
jgi:protease-4